MQIFENICIIIAILSGIIIITSVAGILLVSCIAMIRDQFF